MKKLILFAFAFILSLAVFYSCNEPLVEESTNDALELKSANSGAKSYIVVLNDSELNDELSKLKGYEMRQHAARSAAEKVMNRAGITDGELGFVYGTAIKGFSVKIAPGQLKKLENDPSVIRVSEDQTITLIEPYAKPGGGDVQATAQNIPWGVARVGGGANYTDTNVAWIIDTGIDLDHPDLNVDAGRGKTFVTRTSTPDDDNGHGTHVAGTVAAKNNDVGVIGVAAGATVIPVKVLDRRGSGSISGVIAGVDYVAANGEEGDVANMSLGGSYYKDLNDAVIAASIKVKFALAAGNESTDANTKSPASANGPNIFTISAMDINDNFASFSNYGNPPVDYCEPGVSIYSTYKDGGYITYSGTSMAAPHMAGILMWGLPGTDGTVNGDPDVTNSTPGYDDPIGVVGGGTTPTNNPPVADAGDDIFEIDSDNSGAETVALDGSNSSDPDGDNLTYSWIFENNVISTAESFNYIFPIGAHTVTLTVSDGIATSSDDVIVTVNSGSTSNVVPVINTFDLANTSNPAMKRVQVNWSVTDGDGDLKTVETKLTGLGTASAITNVSGSSASGLNELSIKKGSSGVYSVTIIVTDSAGNVATDSKEITL